MVLEANMETVSSSSSPAATFSLFTYIEKEKLNYRDFLFKNPNLLGASLAYKIAINKANIMVNNV